MQLANISSRSTRLASIGESVNERSRIYIRQFSSNEAKLYKDTSVKIESEQKNGRYNVKVKQLDDSNTNYLCKTCQYVEQPLLFENKWYFLDWCIHESGKRGFYYSVESKYKESITPLQIVKKDKTIQNINTKPHESLIILSLFLTHNSKLVGKLIIYEHELNTFKKIANIQQ